MAALKLVLGHVINHYNVLKDEIDRGLKRKEADNVVVYRPGFSAQPMVARAARRLLPA